jgi:hypothetical protein
MLFTLLLSAIPFSSIVLLSMASTARAPEDAALQGLQLSIARDPARPLIGQPPKFRVELRNGGKDDLILNLGIMLANGRKQYPRAIALILTDPEGKSRVFDLREAGVVASRLDPMIMPLPGATFTLPIDLGNYWPAASKEFEYKCGERIRSKLDLPMKRCPQVWMRCLRPIGSTRLHPIA